ncbi:MAG: fructosamine kinase family protein [Phycisphaerales bacterium]
MDRRRLSTLLAGQVDSPVLRVEPMGSGVGGGVHRIVLADGSLLIAKASAGAARAIDLRVEARMLDLLRERGLPTPSVVAAGSDLLVMERVDCDGSRGRGVEAHAADLLASLHANLSPDGRYGLGEDNTIGSLPQPNGWMDDWAAFFGERRLTPMLESARRVGAVGGSLAARVESLMARLGELVPLRPPASLIHGDVWSGNVLTREGRVAAFIDPAPYHAPAEMELAFIRLFSTFGRAFFDRYAERVGVEVFDPSGFERTRRDLYNLYPLLVHCTLFGAGYAGQVGENLSRLGF